MSMYRWLNKCIDKANGHDICTTKEVCQKLRLPKQTTKLTIHLLKPRVKLYNREIASAQKHEKSSANVKDKYVYFIESTYTSRFEFSENCSSTESYFDAK